MNMTTSEKANHLVYTHFCFRTAQQKYHSTQDFIPSFLECKSEWKTSSKKTPAKTSKTKEATKEIRNDIADGHEMYADMKCTAHGLAIMSFVFAPASKLRGSQIAFFCVASSYHDPPWFKSANAI